MTGVTQRRRRQWALALAASAAVVAASLAPAWASDLEERKGEVENELSEAESELSQSTKALNEATNAYEEADAKLPAAEAALAEAEDAMAAAQDVLARAQAELAAAKAEDARAAERLSAAEEKVRQQEAKIAEINDEIDGKRADMSRLAVQAYQKGGMGELSDLATVLGATSLNDLTTRIGYAQSVLNADDAELTEMQSARARLANERVKLEELRAEAEKLRIEAAEQLERTKELEAAAQAAAAEAAAQEAEIRAAKEAVENLVGKRESAMAKAEKAKGADAQAYSELSAERKKIDEEIADLARKRAAKSESSSGSSSGSSGSGSSSSGSSSSSSRSLGYPVSNPYVTSRYGMRTHPITGVYKLHDGTDFRAYCGVPIRASQSGTVQWASYRGGYGNQVMIDHGRVSGTHVMTSYSHLQSFAVSSGSKVSKGQVVGYSGTTGYSTACHLHFMVYANGTRTNPMSYL